MARGSSARWPWAVCWICLVMAVGGYALLVGLTPPPSPGRVEAASHWLAQAAPIWLVLWLIAAITAGGVAVRRRHRQPDDYSTRSPSADEDGLQEQHRCPDCGARLSLRRVRSGARRGQPQWVCPEHGPVG